MRVIYQKVRRARYLYIKRNVEKVWGVRYTLGARYLSKNTVTCFGSVCMSAEHFGRMLPDALNFKYSVNWGNQWLY